MKRAILVALGTGAIITSAAALTVGSPSFAPRTLAAPGDFGRARTALAAREAPREMIDARYRAVRAQCDALQGLPLDDCLIAAHAFRGRALLEAQAPYVR